MTFILRLIAPLICTLAALTFITSLARADEADETVLTIHAVNFPPYEIAKPGSDGLVGFDVEVVVEAFKRVGLSAKVKFLPWNRIVVMAKKGTTLAMLSCGKNVKDREQYINFSDQISTATHSYVASKDLMGDKLRTITDGKGFKIVVKGYGHSNELDDANVNYYPATDDEAALQILLKRDFDLFYSTREYVQYQAKGLNIADQLQYFDVQIQLDYHLCFSRKSPKSETLHELFNTGLAEIRADGSYDAIHAKY